MFLFLENVNYRSVLVVLASRCWPLSSSLNTPSVDVKQNQMLIDYSQPAPVGRVEDIQRYYTCP